MLQDYMRRKQRLAYLQQQIATMPEYPIYREQNGRYSIYVNRQRRIFTNEVAAREGQLVARAAWLRRQDTIG